MDGILFENEVAIVLIVKNESLYIGEWLDYHYRIGVDKFYIYDNDSEDRSELLEVLNPWIRAGVVDLESVSGVRRQMPVYNDAIEKHRFDCRWMGFIDADEFIYIKTGQNLPEFLHEYFDTKIGVAGLGINWRMFGSNGKQNYESVDVIDRFTRRAPDNFQINFHIKTFANPRLILYFSTPHHAEYCMGCGCFDEHVNLIVEYENDENTCDLIQCNHYYTKSREEFLQKISRGRADLGIYRNFDEKEFEKLNSIEDFGLKSFWRELKNQPISKYHDSKNVLSNIRQMLGSVCQSDISREILDGQTEKLLTCFFLIRNSKFLRLEDKLGLEDLILELIQRTLRETNVEVYHQIMLLLSRQKILETGLKSAIELMKLLLDRTPKLIAIAEDSVINSYRFYLQQIQKDLAMILN